MQTPTILMERIPGQLRFVVGGRANLPNQARVRPCQGPPSLSSLAGKRHGTPQEFTALHATTASLRGAACAAVHPGHSRCF